MPVGTLGPNEVVTVNRDDTLAEAASTLESENVGAVVIAENNQPTGLLTDRDVALAVADGEGVESKNVEEVMTEDPVTVPEDAEDVEIAEKIGEHGVRRFPIVDDDGELAGIATLDDLVATIGEELDAVANTIETQSPDYSP